MLDRKDLTTLVPLKPRETDFLLVILDAADDDAVERACALSGMPSENVHTLHNALNIAGAQ